jgi:arsenate reductase-like glutaredoxin family protein
MAAKIDWMYHRKNCNGCKKAHGFLENAGVAAAPELVDASKEKKGRDEALALAKTVNMVVVARGKAVLTFDMKKAPPDDDTLAAALLGPTGNLKAPTIRKGKTLLVGFGEAAYEHVFGGAAS